MSNLATMTNGSLRQRLRAARIKMVAHQVETQQDYRKACAVGFTLFQGYYFCRPEVIGNRVPSNRLLRFELLRELSKDPLDLKGLCPLVIARRLADLPAAPAGELASLRGPSRGALD